MNELTLERWDRMSASEREAFAKCLARQLPDGFAFRSIRSFRLGDQQHQVAEFEFERASFMLIPGGTITLGYDLDRAWEPTAEELESWRDTAQEHEITGTLLEYIADVTLRPRTVHLHPLLMETNASEVGWEQVSVHRPEVKKVVQEHMSRHSGPGRVEIHGQGPTLRVQRHDDGTITAQRAAERTHAEFAAEWATAGFRLPTSDEWEYACGAGAPTLFRWGDHAPCDRYPTDISPAEAAWRLRWVFSLGTLEDPLEQFISDWDLHRCPNAFGIHIAFDPYKNELVAEPGISRGGDGGRTICGGMGFFVGWLPLATAYFEAPTCEYDPHEPIPAGWAIARRVLSLG